MTVPSGIIVRNDTLILGTNTTTITMVNKNTGTVFWSKSLNTDRIHLLKDKVVYYDVVYGIVTSLSLLTGAAIFQANPITRTGANGLSYIYEDAFYNKIYDTLYCVSLTTGLLKWKKKESHYINKFTVVGKTVYAGNQYGNFAPTTSILIANASDFSLKDSILVPNPNYIAFQFYREKEIYIDESMQYRQGITRGNCKAYSRMK
jgi:outer membrane protein assembly factor BamB